MFNYPSLIVTSLVSFSYVVTLLTHNFFCTCLLQDFSELFTPLTDKDERDVNTLLYGSGHRYSLHSMNYFILYAIVA